MKKKPNIILITTDQQRFDTIQKLGNHSIFTPHLNWLVSEGASFTRCYADCPVCVPSRTTIMTGKKGYVSGVVNNINNSTVMSQSKTLPKILTENGYQTRAVGKMHFEPPRAHHGFEHMVLPFDYYREYRGNIKRPKHHGVGENEVEPVISTVDENESLTTWTVDKSIDFIETRDPTRPFFLWTSFAKPHPPFDPCYNYWAIYENINMPDPIYGDWSENVEDIPKGFLQNTYALNNMHMFTKEQIKNIKRAYYGCISQIDYSLGLFFARLREDGLFENTWIIFTSDHGDMLGDHHMGGKFTFTEGAAHVPFIIRPPDGSLKNKKSNILVELSDLYPTILHIAGLEKYAGSSDGKSVLDLVNTKDDRPFFGNYNNTTFCAMKNNIKYIFCTLGGGELLFDLNNDPYEKCNLMKDIGYKNILEQLKDEVMENIKAYSPSILENGEIILQPAPQHDEDTYKWPGFHSIFCEEFDVLH
ncbi:MAG: sulfatase-like hydrolase/transferase [Lachnospirales bacterium]